MIVLRNNLKERVITFGRPHANGTLYGTTCPGITLGAEKFDVYYSEKPNNQTICRIIDIDTNWTRYRQNVYNIKSLSEVHKAWKIMHEDNNVEVPKPPDNEWEFRKKAWETEYIFYYGCGRRHKKRMPQTLANMD